MTLSLVVAGLADSLAPSAHGQSVKLAWDASSDPTVAGYNLYRSQQSGVFPSTPLNGPTLVPTPAFTDFGVLSGSTYYYVVTAVSTTGLESRYSNQVQATVPVLPAGFTGTAPLPIIEVETGTVRSGYIVVTPDAGMTVPVSTLTYGMVRDGIVQSQTAILPTPLTSESTLIVDIVRAIGRNLGLAIANPSGTPAVITLTPRDVDGNVVSSTSALTISPRTQIARFLTELFPDAIGAAFQGSVTIQSSIPVSIIGLRFSGVEFSTVPIPVSTPVPMPLQGTVGGNNAIIFPQFAMAGGWATTLGLVNTASSPMSGRIDIFDISGNSMAISWNGERESTFTYALPPAGSVLFAPRDSNGQSPF